MSFNEFFKKFKTEIYWNKILKDCIVFSILKKKFFIFAF